MKIAMIAPLAIRVPPKKYGGAEFVVHYLTEELVRRGHEVDLYATGNSLTKANLIKVIKQGIWEGKEMREFTAVYLKMIYGFGKKQNQYDLIHEHMGPIGTVFCKITNTPVISTLHVPLNEYRANLFRSVQSFNLVSISNNQRLPFNDLNYKATVYNGIPVQKYSFNLKSQKYLYFLGRYDNIKGAKESIKVAQKLNYKLLLSAKIEDEKYYHQEIKPEVDRKQIIETGEVGFQQKNKYLRKAKVLLVPINWEEPFGLVVPEANACGTPVVAFARGSMPELIKDGFNGYLVKPGDIKSMTKAVQRIYQMPEAEYRQMRLNCRKHVEENFTVERMVDSYEQVYKKIINSK